MVNIDLIHHRRLFVRLLFCDYYHVLIIMNEVGSVLAPADRGTVQKVIVLPRDDLQTEELVLEEVEVFRVSPLSTLFSSLFVCLFVLIKYMIFIFLFFLITSGANRHHHHEDLIQESKKTFVTLYSELN